MDENAEQPESQPESQPEPESREWMFTRFKSRIEFPTRAPDEFAFLIDVTEYKGEAKERYLPPFYSRLIIKKTAFKSRTDYIYGVYSYRTRFDDNEITIIKHAAAHAFRASHATRFYRKQVTTNKAVVKFIIPRLADTIRETEPNYPRLASRLSQKEPSSDLSLDYLQLYALLIPIWPDKILFGGL